MLDSLMKFGAYRVEHFVPLDQLASDSFGLYIRAEIEKGQVYSHEAKYQLYMGLDLIHRLLGMQNLAGIYLDIDCLKNMQRPAYQQMKSDVLAGYFHRILVLNSLAISICPGSDTDLHELAGKAGGLELLIWNRSKLTSKMIGEPELGFINQIKILEQI